MADNNTPIALPEQTSEADSVLTGAIQATEQAADQQVVPAQRTAPEVAQPAQPNEGGPVGPLGDIVNQQ